MQEKLNILLAEDDENLGMLLHSYLQSKGFQVLLARNGKTAYEKFNGNKIKFDLVIAVDVLHHIGIDQAPKILQKLASTFVFPPSS